MANSPIDTKPESSYRSAAKNKQEGGLLQLKTLLVLAVTASGLAWSATASQAQGTPQEEVACRPDATRFCPFQLFSNRRKGVAAIEDIVEQ